MTFESIKNKTVLLRCDFNEPVKGDVLESAKRIDANIITIHELLARKNKVILISHHSDKGQTLLPVYNYLQKSFNKNSKDNIKYLDTTDTKVVREYFELHKNINNFEKNYDDENLILLENTRLFLDENASNSPSPLERGLGGEAKNLDEKNDLEFAKFLASLGECFVYDAFSVGHRDHASTTGIAKILPSCFGPTFLREYNSLKKITDELGSSLVFMGGAKLSTKLPIIQKFLNGGAVVCVGGAMLHPILQAQNIDIKDSYLEKDFELDKKDLDYLLGEIGQADQKKNLILPKELIWNKESAAEKDRNKIVDNIFDFESINKIILDNNIKNILWNGPVGMYEQGNVTGSREIYKFIKDKKTPITPLSQLRQGYAGQTQRGEDSKLFTVIGGGDTITFLEEEQKIENVNSEINTDKENVAKSFEKDFSYVSLSGGAMLEFLSTGTLPILESVKI